MKNDGKTRKQHNGFTKGMVLFLLIVIATIGVGTVMAKYYAFKSEPGIAVASAFYFNSNKLEKNPGATTPEAIQSMDVTGMSVSVNETKWVGGECVFPIEIRNYDNNLLFNNKDLNSTYEIKFRLIGTPQGATYVAQKMQSGVMTESQPLEADGAVVTFQGELRGGNLKSDQYQISIQLNDALNYDENVKVLVVAYPILPDYLYSADDQQHRLIGLFQGHLSEADMDIESADFLVQREYSDANWKAKVKDLSGLIFNVKTNGDVITDAGNTVKQEAIIKWQSDYLQISIYDKYYLKAEQQGGSWLKQEQDSNGVNWTYMKVEALPYTSINVTFYKTQQFLDKFNASVSAMTRQEFENLADAYVERDTNNNQG